MDCRKIDTRADSETWNAAANKEWATAPDYRPTHHARRDQSVFASALVSGYKHLPIRYEPT
ncbi:MAG: hypothetical protein GY708_04810 [Actinomycetia bacterium]|nr:hypothetical protein [Actinomycetes bacterium]MCP4957944.1 hypothetical protein [Actinomycetes bacterium]